MWCARRRSADATGAVITVALSVGTVEEQKTREIMMSVTRRMRRTQEATRIPRIRESNSERSRNEYWETDVARPRYRRDGGSHKEFPRSYAELLFISAESCKGWPR